MAGNQVLVALALSLIGCTGTALGGLIVVLQRQPNAKRLGVLQGFAGGLMMSISVFDLVHNSINAVGFPMANVWFFAGILLFQLICTFIPEPSLDVLTSSVKDEKKSNQGEKKENVQKFKELSPTEKKKHYKVDDLLSAPSEEEDAKGLWKKRKRQVMLSGIITAVGISLHNFPEGIAVFLGSMKGLRVGASLAFAIALHNIPEGIAVALPMYFATESKWRSFKIAALSGIAEPLGVIFVAFFFPSNLSPEIVEGMLGAVGGIMTFLTIQEMLPYALDSAGHKGAVSAFFFGMAFMSLSLCLLEAVMPKEIQGL